MRNWPTNLMEQHSLLIAALCEDLLAGHRGLDGPNVSRVSEINRQINQSPTTRDSGVANNSPETNK